MKILSIEKNIDNIEYALRKHILIPCWVYNIPIKVKKNGQLNFIERTVLELIQIDSSLKYDIKKLSEMLGFFSNDEKENRTEILELILKKITCLKLEDIENELKEENLDVINYKFYQEAYNYELLPIVTKDISTYTYSDNNSKFHENFYREITFKSSISSGKTIRSLLVDKFDKKQFTYPSQSELIKTIFLHNQNMYEGSHKIEYKDNNIEISGKPELIYIHTKLYIPNRNIQQTIMTNGFTNGFSSLLKNTFQNTFQDFLNLLRQELKSDLDKRKDTDIYVPFESNINNYPMIVNNLRVIEKEIRLLENNLSNNIEVKKAKKIAERYYDIIEELLKILTIHKKENSTLRNKNILKELAKDIGFKIDNNVKFKIFNVSTLNNLQRYLAKAILYKMTEMYEIADKYPELIHIINELFVYRNVLKHSEKETTLRKINEKDLIKYKNIIYDIVSIILKIKQTKQEIEVFNDDVSYIRNAYIKVESELSIETISKLPQEIKDNLLLINFYLGEENDFNVNRYNTVKEVINSMYSTFEYILKKFVSNIPLDEKKQIVNKEVILNKIQSSNIVIPKSLTEVREKILTQALENKGGSLGAYMLLYLYFKDTNDDKFVTFIENLLVIRGHGTPTIEEVQKITEEKLNNLKKETLMYLEKILEEI